MRKNILFIINPISGGKAKTGFPALAERHLDLNLFRPKYKFTEYPGHAFELARDAVANNIEIVVAVGGDGTINEVGSALESTPFFMGIIPCGSGNGLARSLKISLNNAEAIKSLNKLDSVLIDTACLDRWKFFNIGGIGFDAHISHKFSNLVKRGFKGYVKTTLYEVFSYRPQFYRIKIDGKLIETSAFMISVANSSQFGNNAHISPTASLMDGLLDVCIVKPFPLYHFPIMGYRLFSKTSDRSRYIEIIKGKDIRIETDKPRVIHIDGEPKEITGSISITIKPLSLKILH
ncbi:diacylglycerol/lipid kinase family protein [Desertivirga xinjiangensis]|uniref:diacylglycerol/lipid kinase family protein n=1 Tax=Desertivirga xinjiangensis TaxID=539206 RepID=UPI00210BFA84